jgi:hypothetical protein
MGKVLLQNLQQKAMSEFAEFLSFSNPLKLRSDLFPSCLCRPGVINKDPTAWLDEARPPLSTFSKN